MQDGAVAVPDRQQADDVFFVDVEPHHDAASTLYLGFWFYLMSDCLLFAGLFATFAVLHGNTAGGPTPAQLFDLPYTFGETMFLLCSSFTCGLATLAMNADRQRATLGWLAVTFVLGLGFISMEIHEFLGLIAIGATAERSAFLSCFFTLVGTHGLHVTFGLIFMAVMMIAVARKGLTATNRARLNCVMMFWHFLDIIWVGVFSLVYLSGMVH
jgi:cytochrome o ubiquinol oxidase subunit 3